MTKIQERRSKLGKKYKMLILNKSQKRNNERKSTQCHSALQRMEFSLRAMSEIMSSWISFPMSHLVLTSIINLM
jgi:hypothetical protein